MKKKVLILILFVLILLFSTTVYANHRDITIAPEEYLICSKALDIIKIMTMIIVILVILQIVIKKMIQNKIILKINLVLLICSIIGWSVTSIIWLINYIKIM